MMMHCGNYGGALWGAFWWWDVVAIGGAGSAL